MVGIRSFHFGKAYFHMRTVRFREGEYDRSGPLPKQLSNLKHLFPWTDVASNCFHKSCLHMACWCKSYMNAKEVCFFKLFCLFVTSFAVFVVLYGAVLAPVFSFALFFLDSIWKYGSVSHALSYLTQTKSIFKLYLEPFNDPCFDWKRPCFGGWKPFKNRGHLGSRYIVIAQSSCLFSLCASLRNSIVHIIRRWFS